MRSRLRAGTTTNKSGSTAQCLSPCQLLELEHGDQSGGWDPRGKDATAPQQAGDGRIPQPFTQGPTATSWVTNHWGNENTQTVRGLLDGAWLAVIPEANQLHGQGAFRKTSHAHAAGQKIPLGSKYEDLCVGLKWGEAGTHQAPQ